MFERGAKFSEAVKKQPQAKKGTNKAKATRKAGTTRPGKENVVGVDALELISKRRTIPPYEFFKHAEEWEIPPYKIELAKSGRSKCTGARGDAKSTSLTYCKNMNLGAFLGASCACASKASRKSRTNKIVVSHEFGTIAQSSIRIGMMDASTGEYGRFRHLACWRVPKAVWLALPQVPGSVDYTETEFLRCLTSMNECIFCGFDDLCELDRLLVARQSMDQSMWASFQDKKFVALRAANLPSNTEATQNLASSKDGDTADGIVPRAKSKKSKASKGGKHRKAAVLLKSSDEATVKNDRETPPSKIRIPQPHIDGAIARTLCKPDQSSRPLTFVLTGTFQDLGGGIGLCQGKEMAQKLIERFGGVVRSAVSGKTDVLLVGEDPGVGKLSAARAREKIKIWNLEHVLDIIHGRTIQNKPLRVEAFSAGFRGNSLAYGKTKIELDALRFGGSDIATPTETKVLPSSKSRAKEAPEQLPAPTPKAKKSKKRAISGSTEVRRSSRRCIATHTNE